MERAFWLGMAAVVAVLSIYGSYKTWRKGEYWTDPEFGKPELVTKSSRPIRFWLSLATSVGGALLLLLVLTKLFWPQP